MEKCKVCGREMVLAKPYGETSHVKYLQCPKCKWKKYVLMEKK